jgi:hypothetical protein
MAKPYTFRKLIKKLRKYDSRFEVHVHRGKGSERILYHPDVNGRPESHPVKHHGDNTELRKGVISSIIRRFDLPRDLL